MGAPPVSTARLTFGFLWRGALLGIAGGVVIPSVALFLFSVGFIMADDSTMGAITRFTVPLGAALGGLAGYGAARLDGTEDSRAHIAVAGLIGLGMGGHIASLFALMLAIFGLVPLVGGAAGLAGGLLIAAVAAGITRARHFPPGDTERYTRALRPCLATVAFVAGIALWVPLVRSFYGLWDGQTGTTLFWVAVSAGVGLLSALFVWLTSPCLTDWYVRALAREAPPPAPPPAEAEPVQPLPDATA